MGSPAIRGPEVETGRAGGESALPTVRESVDSHTSRSIRALAVKDHLLYHVGALPRLDITRQAPTLSHRSPWGRKGVGKVLLCGNTERP